MSIRPRGLADRSANRDPSEDRYVRETVSLPRDEACAKAKSFLNRTRRPPQ
jgi:hypothetical protein